MDSGVESPSRWFQVADLVKLRPLLSSLVDPVHKVLYVPKTWVASLVPIGAFQVALVVLMVLMGGRWEAGGAETGRGEKHLRRRVW